MVARLLDPSEGVIRMDGHDLKHIPVNTLRRSIGYVPQDVFLFSDTVANNIAFGNLDATQEEIEQATREAELLDNIADFPEGFRNVRWRTRHYPLRWAEATELDRQGSHSPARVLILDDALSAVDTNTESKILSHLRSQFGQRTIIIVSHRISAVQDADLILVLDEGHIIEKGNHDELLSIGGLYADLYQKQLLEAEIELIS